MEMFLGPDFELLTIKNVEERIDFDLSQKQFYFAGIPDKKANDISMITAKADFIRFRHVRKNGGVWLDCDTIVLKPFIDLIRPLVNDQKLAWHSEQFFGALPENDLITTIEANMLSTDRQTFANPGSCKEVIQDNRDAVSFIPSVIWDPTNEHSYSSKNWEDTASGTLQLSDFLKNDNCCIVKMYNSMMRTMAMGDFSPEQFLRSGSLVANIFLSIEPDISIWRSLTADVENRVRYSGT